MKCREQPPITHRCSFFIHALIRSHTTNTKQNKINIFAFQFGISYNAGSSLQKKTTFILSYCHIGLIDSNFGVKNNLRFCLPF